MDTSRSINSQAEENRRGRKQKELSKLASEFKPINSSKPCGSKSFAESKRNTFILKLLKSADFHEEFINIEALVTGIKHSNQKSRFIAERLQNQWELLFRIKSKFLRLYEWYKVLLIWLKIEYCGKDQCISKARLLLDLIFVNLGLTEEIELELMRELDYEHGDYCELDYEYGLYCELENLENCRKTGLCYRDETENNRKLNIDKKELFIDLIEPKICGVEIDLESHHGYSTAFGSDDEDF